MLLLFLPRVRAAILLVNTYSRVAIIYQESPEKFQHTVAGADTVIDLQGLRSLFNFLFLNIKGTFMHETSYYTKIHLLCKLKIRTTPRLL